MFLLGEVDDEVIIDDQIDFENVYDMDIE